MPTHRTAHDPIDAKFPERLSVWGFGLATGALPVVNFFSTRSAPAVVALGAALLLVSLALEGRLGDWRGELNRLSKSGLALIGAALVVWAIVVPFLGSPVPAGPFAELRFAGSLALIGLWYTLARTATSADHTSQRLTQFAGLLVCGALILIERRSGYSIRAAVGLDHLPHITNRTAVVLVVLTGLFLGGANRKADIALTAVAAVWCGLVVFLMIESQTAEFMVAVFVPALGLALVAPRTAAWSVATIAIALLLLGPILLTHFSLPDIDWLKPFLAAASATHRIEIWSSFAPYIFERPLTGYGVGAESMLMFGVDTTSGREVSLQAHPHSVLIQGWINFGLVGITMLALAVFRTVAALACLEAWPRAVGTALFASCFAAASVSHGAWQEWWMIIVGMSFAEIVRVGRLARSA